jgi:hypothetical protein
MFSWVLTNGTMRWMRTHNDLSIESDVVAMTTIQTTGGERESTYPLSYLKNLTQPHKLMFGSLYYRQAPKKLRPRSRAIKRKLLANQRRPDFPTSLWSDVISNSFVDLNRVFDFRRSAWDRYQGAALFLYPHRTRELTDYAKDIVDTFIAVPGSPDRVILYNKRVRTRVAESIGLPSDTAT